jgi:hypothetical protein
MMCNETVVAYPLIDTMLCREGLREATKISHDTQFWA